MATNGKHTYYRFGGNSATNFSFPFKVEYTTALDPDGVVLKTLIGEHHLRIMLEFLQMANKDEVVPSISSMFDYAQG